MRLLMLRLVGLSICGVASVTIAAQLASEPRASGVASEAPVEAEEARETALSLAQILEEDYAIPEVGARYAAALRAKAAAGAYDGPLSPLELARILTAEVQAVAPDNHLRVGLRPALSGGPQMVRVGPGGQPAGGGSQPMRIGPAGTPAPIEVARWLAPGIAYIRFTVFEGGEREIAAIHKFMRDHADAATLIIDIRTHRGGGLAEMDAILPYLYNQETRLLQMDTRASVDRRNGSPIGEEPSLRVVAGPEGVVRREHFVRPHATEKRLQDAKVYLLTSNFTASAAEHFALALKRTGRATLVGQETAGAGNFGGMRRVGERFAAFIPVGMTRDPETGERWEGTGIKPDIEVPAERALIEALKLGGVPAEEAERLSAEVHPKGPMQRMKPAA